MKSSILCLLLWPVSTTAALEAQNNNLIQNPKQDDRSLQGFGNDPTACTTDGEYFTCVAPNQFTQGGNTTRVDNTIRCELSDSIGFNFQARPEVCTCHARLTEGSRVRDCACSVCPYGRAQAVALDCSVWPEDPFVAGPCTSLDCDGRCNGTGAAVVNQPTPAPEGAYGEGDEGEDGSGVGIRSTPTMGFVLGTLISLHSWLL